jgi:uncharacterized damage-inducible protein DinB
MTSELEHYLQMIEDLRGQAGELIVGLPTEALNWCPIDGDDDHTTNSLAVLAAHIAGSEHFWITQVVGGRPVTRDRDAEFAAVTDNADQLRRRLDKAGVETREILSALKAADLDGTREVKGRTVSVRWCILHVIDHTALHLGHMQLTYQLWMSGKAGPSPRWFQRVGSG